jgi:hypothetical protein
VALSCRAEIYKTVSSAELPTGHEAFCDSPASVSIARREPASIQAFRYLATNVAVASMHPQADG